MAPVSAAERAALDGFFKGKRGTRVLIRTSADALTTYFADKGTTLAELNTSRPGTDGGTGIGVCCVVCLGRGEVGPSASRPVRRVSGGDGRRALVTWLGVLERPWRYRRHPENHGRSGITSRGSWSRDIEPAAA